MTLKESIPDGLYQVIEQHLHNVCRDSARSSWRRNKSKEDSISGAFFQGIAAENKSWGDWSWDVEYNNVSSHLIEPRLGADGIFQVEVRGANSILIFRKGFLFQSKKVGNKDRARLKEQLEDIERHVPNGGLLITYDEQIYKAVPATTYLHKNNWASEERNICTFLVQRFLTCRFGIQDLYYDFGSDEIMRNGVPLPITPRTVSSINIKKED